MTNIKANNMRWTHKLLISMFVAMACSSVALAGTSGDEARALVQQLGDRTVVAIKLKGKQERRDQLIADGAPAMDYQTISKSVLAYAGAKVSSSRETEVADAVILFVSSQILDKIETVRPDKAEITKVDEKNADTVLVAMTLTGPQDSIVGVWTVKQAANVWLVTDVSVSGVSLSMHFGQKLARHADGGMDQLVAYLKANSPEKRAVITVAR